MTHNLDTLRTRLQEILRRHVKVEDRFLSDHEFVLRVMERYNRAREDLLIDPNE